MALIIVFFQAKLYQLYNQTEDAILAYQQAFKQENNVQVAQQISWLQKQLQIKHAQQREHREGISDATKKIISAKGAAEDSKGLNSKATEAPQGLPGIRSTVAMPQPLPHSVQPDLQIPGAGAIEFMKRQPSNFLSPSFSEK